MRTKGNEMMLPRQATNIVKYDYKKPVPSPTTKLTGLAALQQNSQLKMTKAASAKPKPSPQAPEMPKKKLVEPKSRLEQMAAMRKAKSNVGQPEPKPAMDQNKVMQHLKNKNAQGNAANSSGGFTAKKQMGSTLDSHNAASQLQSRLRPPTNTESLRPKTSAPVNHNYQPDDNYDLDPDNDYYANNDDDEPIGEEKMVHLKEKHERLVNKILQEEDDLLANHKTFIDTTVDIVKSEMNLLHEVDKPGSDVEDYILNLDTLLKSKIDMIHKLRSQLARFYDNIKEEQELSNLFHEMKNQGDSAYDNEEEPDENRQPADYYLSNLNQDHLNGVGSPLNIEDNLLADDDMLMEDVSDELYKL